MLFMVRTILILFIYLEIQKKYTKFGSSDNTEIWVIKSLLYLLFSSKTSNRGESFSMISDIEFTPDRHFYKPVIFYNDFWNMKRDYFPINDTIK